jgi:hypothetical protein
MGGGARPGSALDCFKKATQTPNCNAGHPILAVLDHGRIWLNQVLQLDWHLEKVLRP